MNTRYNPGPVEQKWYLRWQEMGLFEAKPRSGSSSYTVLMPPPNITGRLHMGHLLNNTLQDVLVRRKRMQGYVSCWVPGIDHASIATEAKVVALLRAQRKTKQEIGRDAFLRETWAWKEKYGDIILKQLFRLGVSCDWSRSCFTMDEPRSRRVLRTFIQLHEEGHIYRRPRIVNWDPEARTALSDEEVYHKEVDGYLYHIAYPIEESEDVLVVATTRPETMLGDVALCVHPKDPRYASLVGKRARLPLLDRSLPIISDTYVDMKFGTGCLKITPAHDANDYLIAERHHLPSINIFDERGYLNKEAEILIGVDRFEARVEILKMLKDQGYLRKEQPLRHSVSYSERTQVVVEPRLSLEWFCRMSELAAPALEAVERGEIRFFPDHLRNTYRHWMTHIKDWCISRQLWWGHRIPVWYTNSEQTEYILAQSQEEALEVCRRLGKSCSLDELTQEERVLDTWFSSWLWPISVFDGAQKSEPSDMSYFYPTDDLITGPDILFFWVARMIMAGYAFTKERPFKNVYFTGIVRDKERRKMSKSLGNSPDPIELIDQYGADSIRMGMMMCGNAGNDILFDESLCRQGRDFSNKLWNALRLIKSWSERTSVEHPSVREQRASAYFSAQIQYLIEQTEALYEQFRISDVAISLYKFVREDFCNTYLELLKPPSDTGLGEGVLEEVIGFFEQLLKLLHPFMPFLSEEIWDQISSRATKERLMIASYPQATSYDRNLLEKSNYLRDLLSSIRRVLNNYGWKSNQALILEADVSDNAFSNTYSPFLDHVFRIKQINLIERTSFFDQMHVFLIGTDAFALRSQAIDAQEQSKASDPSFVAQQIAQTKKEIKRLLGFHQQTSKRLSSEKFIHYAKQEIIEKERKKSADTLKKIHLQLSKLRHVVTSKSLAKGERSELEACIDQAEAYIAENKS